MAELNIPEQFNAAVFFVDRNVSDGRGDHVAIECGETRVTYRELLECVNRIGSALKGALQVRMEERVMLLLPDGPEIIYSFFGAMKIGAVPVPVNTLWRTSDFEYVLNDCRCRVLIVSEDLLPRVQALPRAHLPFLEQIVIVGNGKDIEGGQAFADLLAAGSPELMPAPTCRDDAAFWLYSSGSTGRPKGCVHLHHDMPFCAATYAQEVLRTSARDRFFSVAKIFFAYGLGNAVYFPFAVGATTILWPGAPTAANVFSVIERHRPTLLFSVPTNFAMLLAHEGDGREFDLSSVRLGVSAGEALPPSVFQRFKRRFGVDILDGIGSSEILHIFISNRAGEVRPGSSGVLVPGYEARLLDDAGKPVERGQIGNLLISGDSTCSMYWNQHEKTRTTIEGRWIRTGDKYYQDEDGFFWYAGRTDDMLKVGGIWVSPVEVENALIEHPAVLECAVIGRGDRDQLQKPVAYVVLKRDGEGSPELAAELQQFVRSRLSDYKRPRWIAFVQELPKTPTGKIQRFKLRESDQMPLSVG